MLKRIETPMMSSGQGLKLPEDIEKNALGLYRETEDKYTFVGLYDPDIPDNEYEDGIAAIPLKSIYRQPVFLPNGTALWNVLGSSGDHLKDPDTDEKYDPWIGAWIHLSGHGDKAQCYVTGGISSACHSKLVGGHMQATDPKGKKLESGKTVYILPICARHNNHSVIAQLTVVNGQSAAPMPYVPGTTGVWALEIEYERPK